MIRSESFGVAAEAMRAFAEATSSDYQSLLDTIVRAVALSVQGFCSVMLPSADGVKLELRAAHDEDARLLALAREMVAAVPSLLDSELPAALAFRGGEALLIPQLDEAYLQRRFTQERDRALMRELEPRSMLLIPLRARGRSLGLLTVITHGAGVGPLTNADVQAAQLLADHAALALANAHLLRDAATEIAQRRAAEAALAISEERLRQIVETAHEGIWVLDGERRTTYANRRMGEMLGTTPEVLLGRSALDFVPPDGRAASDAGIARRKAGITERIDLQLKRTDGTLFDARASASPIMREGVFLGSVYLVTDETQTRALEEQLRQSQKMEAVGRLAGGVAHDFNNMLSVILSSTTMALDELPATTPTTVREDLGQVLEAADRARALTQQILAFSRKQLLKPVVLDANETLRAVEPMLRRLLTEDIKVRLALAGELGRVKADPGQLQQVLLNLVVNARDAMPDGGQLLLETANVVLDESYAKAHPETQVGPHVMIAVSDSGVGMDKATQARIFEPFFTTKGPGRGTGLGLSTVFGIVKQSGGSIWAYSEVGRGTTFKLYFPCTDEEVVAARPSAPKATTLRGSETVLLVEDEPALRGIVAAILERAGYRVLVTTSPSNALEQARAFQGSIALLLTDVVMPEMSGKVLAQAVVKLRPDTRVLYMSGYTENTIVHHGVLDEGIAFLPKPITPDALLAKVRQLLDRPDGH